MEPGEPSDDAAVFDFLDELLRDLERGKRLPLSHYLARYAGHEEAVASEYLAELERAGLSSAPRPPVPTASSEHAGAEDPSRVGPYRLLRELGRGGQGAVWLAEDTRLTRLVALKLLPAEFAALSTERRRRLQREAEVIARLDHPCLCAVLEARIDGEKPYIAMRYVEGASLGEWIARAREAKRAGATGKASASGAPGPLRLFPRNALEQAGVLAFFERAARALHAAHEAGVVHRDVKPQNVMVTPNGDPVVLDFGQARDETSDSFELTRSGDILGTPAYMSPEQILGRREGVDRRTDVWGLGTALYEALTLTRPFQGENVPALFLAIREAPLVDPRELNPAVSADLAVVVAAALEKEPGRRYATALDLALDLRRVREYEPVHARPPSAIRVVRGWFQRHPALAYSTLGTIVALAIGLASSLHLLAREREANDFALGLLLGNRTGELIDEDPAAALALGIDAAERAEGYQTRAALFRALQACHLRSVIQTAPAPRALDCSLSHDGRRAAIALDDGGVRICELESGASLLSIPGTRPQVRAVRFSADDGRLAFVDAAGRAQVCDATDGRVQAEFDTAGGEGRAIGFLEGDARVLALSDQGVVAADAGGGGVDWTWRIPEPDAQGRTAHAALHAGAGRALIWTVGKDRAGSARAWLLDTRDGSLLRELSTAEGFTSAEFRADGAGFATGNGAGSIELWRAEDGEPRARHDHPSGSSAVRVVRFSPDGRRLAALLDEGRPSRAWLWYLDSGASVPLAGMGDVRVVHAAFSPDGQRLATVGSDMLVRLWNGSLGRAEASFRGLLLQPFEVAWSSDGRRLVTLTNGYCVQVWYANARPDVFALRGSAAAVCAARFAPDGERTLTASEDGSARMWATPSVGSAGGRPDAGELLFTLEHRGAVRDCAFSPDGARVVTAGDDGSARLWDASDGAELRALVEGEEGLVAIAYGPTSRGIALRTSRGEALVCDPEGARAARRLGAPSPVRAMAWFPDGERLVTAHDDNSARTWEASSGRLLETHEWTTKDHRVPGGVALAVRGDGGEFALACRDGRARFFRPGAPGVLPELVLFPPRSISYSQDATRLLVTGGDGRGAVRLQDLRASERVPLDVYHIGNVTGGAFSPDGKWLITTAKAGGAYVRGARDGLPYAHFPGPGGACSEGAISPGPGPPRALAAFDDGAVWVWPIDPLPAARARQPRPLTELEAQREARHALPLRYVPRHPIMK